MNNLEALSLGIIQGLTEFLPVSSSGHLALLQNYFKEVNVGFDIIIHFATLLAIFVFFYKDILIILKDVFSWNTKSNNFKFGWFVVFATIPIGLVGFFLKDIIYNIFSNLYFVALGFFISGMFLFVASFSNKKSKLTGKNSFIIGLSQALALVPGISRSGSTVSTGVILGIERKEAIKFSFLLGIPAMIGANILNFTDIKVVEVMPFSIGFIAAFISGLLAINLFFRYVKIKNFKWFAVYCWILGILTLLTQIF